MNRIQRWRLQFTTFAVREDASVFDRRTLLLGQSRIYEGRTLRSVAMQAGIA